MKRKKIQHDGTIWTARSEAKRSGNRCASLCVCAIGTTLKALNARAYTNTRVSNVFSWVQAEKDWFEEFNCWGEGPFSAFAGCLCVGGVICLSSGFCSFCLSVSPSLSISLSVCLIVCVHVLIRIYVWLHVCIYVCMYLCMYVSTYAHTSVCVCVCVCMPMRMYMGEVSLREKVCGRILGFGITFFLFCKQSHTGYNCLQECWKKYRNLIQSCTKKDRIKST